MDEIQYEIRQINYVENNIVYTVRNLSNGSQRIEIQSLIQVGSVIVYPNW